MLAIVTTLLPYVSANEAVTSGPNARPKAEMAKDQLTCSYDASNCTSNREKDGIGGSREIGQEEVKDADDDNGGVFAAFTPVERVERISRWGRYQRFARKDQDAELVRTQCRARCGPVSTSLSAGFFSTSWDGSAMPAIF